MGFAGDNNRAIGSPILTSKNCNERGFERTTELVSARSSCAKRRDLINLNAAFGLEEELRAFGARFAEEYVLDRITAELFSD